MHIQVLPHPEHTASPHVFREFLSKWFCNITYPNKVNLNVEDIINMFKNNYL